jgi:2-phosphosulfolactate phosphatase
MPQIKVCLSPALFQVESEVESSIVVVIDILRATTSMCVALDFGAEAIIPVKTIEECLQYKEQGYLISAERNAIPVDGFDFGNSPFSFMSPMIKGKEIVMSTTNGTVALHTAKNAQEVVIGAFANQSILEDYLRFRQQDVILLCSGWKYEINIEDTIFAGAVVAELEPYFTIQNDAAMLAMYLYKEADQRKKYFMQKSTHFHRLIEMDLQADVKYSLRRDTHPVLPIYHKETNRIVDAKYQPHFLCLNRNLYRY